jgi:hypothetical protein
MQWTGTCRQIPEGRQPDEQANTTTKEVICDNTARPQ